MKKQTNNLTIGDTFTLEGVTYKIEKELAPSEPCKGCAANAKSKRKLCPKLPECESSARKDEINVIFVAQK